MQIHRQPPRYPIFLDDNNLFLRNEVQTIQEFGTFLAPLGNPRSGEQYALSRDSSQLSAWVWVGVGMIVEICIAALVKGFRVGLKILHKESQKRGDDHV